MLKSFQGKRPQVDPSVFLAETAVLIGDVTVGKESSIWFGAVLRGDNASIHVGEGTSVQDNVTVHCEPGGTVYIGSNVRIGHNAVVHCSEVGDNTLVGMGAILLDGAKIGKGCIIGAGAVVKQGAVVPDGTMMLGVPAKPVKTLDEATIRAMEEDREYVILSRKHMAESEVIEP